MRRYRWIIFLAFALTLCGCQVRGQSTLSGEAQFTSPTLHSRLGGNLFTDGVPVTPVVDGFAVPTVAGVFSAQVTSDAVSTPEPPAAIPTATASPIVTQIPDQMLVPVTLFDDAFHRDWGVLENQEVDVEMVGAGMAYLGKKALAVTPRRDFSQFFIIVKPDARKEYLRSEVYAIKFWINGGSEPINPGDLAFTVVGSNENPYWAVNDRSVSVNGEFPFSETRLNFLGFNRAIPVNTWVEIVVILDDLIYDPYYDYVTGFYLKNDKTYDHTFYIDEVSLVLIKETPSGQNAPLNNPAIE